MEGFLSEGIQKADATRCFASELARREGERLLKGAKGR